MNKPTEEQVKEFWEWCGFTYDCDSWNKPSNPHWHTPKGFAIRELPTISQQSLVKYAVPDNCSISFNITPDEVVCMLTIPNPKGTYGSKIFVGKAGKKEHALALFWAMQLYRLRHD